MKETGSHLAAVPLNTQEISQSQLNIENKTRSNLLVWNGQFSPQLIETLLEHYAAPDYRVLDPFMGSGTLLYECGRIGVEAWGSDINPAAYSLAKIYELINITPAQRAKEIERFEAEFLPNWPMTGPLFGGAGADNPLRLGQNRKLPDAQKTMFETLVILLNLSHNEKLSGEKLFSAWRRLLSILRVLPYSARPITPLNADARRLPLENGSIDFVITSPPYINVFNYHQQYRGSAEALGWNLLDVARSEIGSNRKHRGNRFLTVVQYCLDIMQALDELRRVCKTNARIIFVVGRESRVRGTAFYNGEIVGRVATLCAGFRLVTRQERMFTNRFGARIYEDILHFTPDTQVCKRTDVRIVAHELLETALSRACDDVESDITSALSQVNTILPSRLFNSGAGPSRSEMIDAYTATPG